MFSQQRQIILLQSLVLVVTSLGLLVIGGPELSGSFFAGGLVALVPSLIFVLVVCDLLHSMARSISSTRIYLGEAIKFVLSSLGFSLVFLLLAPTLPEVVFLGFFVALMVQLAAGFWFCRQVNCSDWLRG